MVTFFSLCQFFLFSNVFSVPPEVAPGASAPLTPLLERAEFLILSLGMDVHLHYRKSNFWLLRQVRSKTLQNSGSLLYHLRLFYFDQTKIQHLLIIKPYIICTLEWEVYLKCWMKPRPSLLTLTSCFHVCLLEIMSLITKDMSIVQSKYQISKLIETKIFKY